MPNPSEFILASGSPRRCNLLAKDGWKFRVVVPNVEEYDSGVPPMEMVGTNARLKAKAVAGLHPDALVLGSDTTVALGEAILNKPIDFNQACDMLRQLSGKSHHVHTAFALIHAAGGVEDFEVVSSRVQFKTLDASVIETYLSRVHTLDKAGGYAIQEHGDLIIQSYEEPLSCIVGLPIETVRNKLCRRGFDKLFLS